MYMLIISGEEGSLKSTLTSTIPELADNTGLSTEIPDVTGIGLVGGGGVTQGVGVTVGHMVIVGVGVLVGVFVGVFVGLFVGVMVGVNEGVDVGVIVGFLVGVFVGSSSEGVGVGANEIVIVKFFVIISPSAIQHAISYVFN